MRPKTIHHAEFQILRFLLNGDGANLGDLSTIATSMNAGLNPEGPVDKTAHNRFNAAVKNIHAHINRRLEQMEKKIQGDA